MSVLKGKHTSIWMDTVEASPYPQVKDGLHVDVAIIGGGLAGLNVAYQLKKKGKKVAVIEASRIGQGVSGHTTAHITAEHNLIYDYLIDEFGEQKARIYAEANSTAIEVLTDIIKHEKITCDFEQQDQFLFAASPKDIPKLRKEFQAAQYLGLPVTWEEKTDLPFVVAGAIKYAHQARFHPRKYMVQLAKIIDGDGSYVFEQSRVIDVQEKNPCIVKTDKSALTATDVIVATNFPILDRGGFFARMIPMRSYVLGVYVKEKLQAMYDDTAEPFHYIRNQETKDGTLVLIGGEDHITGQKEDTYQCYQRLEKYAREHFTVKSIAYSWSSQDTYPHDKVPFIGKYNPTAKHLFVSTGYYGYGMTNSIISSLLLTDMIIGVPNSWEALYTPQRLQKVELSKLAAGGYFNSKNITDNFLDNLKAKVASHSTEKINITSQQAKILNINKEKVGVYKDEEGELHAVCVTCTHQGCGLAFNTAEKSWDCPCHGSRFDTDGEVLQAPTTKPLKKVHLTK